MATQYDDLYQAGDADVEAPVKKRGCFFYGCITAIVLAVVGALVIGLGTYFGARYLINKAMPYTDDAPTPLPPVEMAEADRASVRERFQAFRSAIDTDTPTEPLVLTADEINALIEENEEMKGRVHVDLEGDKIRGQVSIPLDAVPGFKGRYLNGVGVLKVGLFNGVLVVTADSLEVKGKPVPEEFMTSLRQRNLAESATRDPDNAEQIRKLESVEVKDGKLIITPKAKAKAKAGADADMPAGESALEPPKPEVGPTPDPIKPEAEPALDPIKPEAEPALDPIKPEAEPAKPDAPAPPPAPEPAKPDELKSAA